MARRELSFCSNRSSVASSSRCISCCIIKLFKINDIFNLNVEFNLALLILQRAILSQQLLGPFLRHLNLRLEQILPVLDHAQLANGAAVLLLVADQF